MPEQPVASDKVPTNELYILAVGASAGGLEALQDFLTHYPATLKNTAIIIAQHLSPTHKSLLVQLLRKETNLLVEEATDGKELSANVIYITPPNADISIEQKVIRLTKPLSAIGPKPSVDILFSAVATAFKSKAIAVILSGTGSDGSIGISAIKKMGGFVVVQEPESAKFNGMPNTAIETGMADMILTPDKMGMVIEQHIKSPGNDISNALEGLAPSAAWDNIFSLLSKHKGTDFTHYKPSTIGRRLTKRLGVLKLKTPEDYYQYLQDTPSELDELFSIFLISVTNFFRDNDAFGVLEDVLNKIILKKNPGESIRVWVAGCATGEEAYSIAILLADILKDKIGNYNIQIFATDIDEKAIQFARKGIYTAKAIEDIPLQIQNTYFFKTDDGFEITKQVKSMVLFSRHDIASNPPFLKLDLLSCRNLLIYFDDKLQNQIFPIFHYALNPGAYLFLGRAESIGQFGDLFSVVDDKNKMFQRKPGANRAIKLTTYATPLQPKPVFTGKVTTGPQSIKELVKETLFNAYEHAYVVINEQYDIQEVYGDVRPYLSFPEGGVNINILKLVNSDLQIELRSVITRCIKEQQQVKSVTRKFELFDKTYYLRVTARPAIGEFRGQRYYIIIFEQVEKDEFLYQVNSALLKDTSAVDIARLEQELAATKEHLQTYIEELETANEELQSLNEEMQSTNEELQSTNEELETTNEELQSTSEEVQITYSELNASYGELQRKEEQIRLNEANLNALLSNTLQTFYLIDNNYKIITFNKKAAETVWQLYNKKINKGDSVFEILDPEHFEPFVLHFKMALTGEVAIGDTKLNDRAGNAVWYLYNYSPVITREGIITGVSVSYLDITNAKMLETNLNTTEKLLSSVFNATATGMSVIDEEGLFVDVNYAFCQLFQYERSELLGHHHAILFAPEFEDFARQSHFDFIAGKATNDQKEMQAFKKDGSPVDIYVNAELLIQNDGKRYKVKSVRDITERKKLQKLLNDTNELTKVGSWDLDIENKALYWSSITRQIHEVSEDFIPELGKGLLFYKEGENRNKLNELINKALQTGETWDAELEMITAQGNEKWVRINGKAELKGNKVVRMFGAVQDIHERKIAEEKLKDLNQQLEISVNKLEISNAELEQFAYVASHDLQEPLRMVSSFVQLLENKYVDQLDDAAKQYIHFAVDGAARMKNLIMDLLEYSRVGTNTDIAGNTDMNEVVEEVLQVFKDRIQESGAEIIITTDLPVVPHTIRIQMLQLMQNLLGNALKYAGTKKPIIIIDVKEQQDKWLFSIKDNGIGFDKNFAEKIFIIFQRLHNTKNYSGTGIGLSICKKIIELHGGKIWATSEPGEGSVFYFSLLK